MLSYLQRTRQGEPTDLPKQLSAISRLTVVESSGELPPLTQEIASLFPHLQAQKPLQVTSNPSLPSQPLRVGVLFSGGQAAGGHNVIAGLFDALNKINPESRLIGFLGGPSGLLESRSLELTENVIAPYRNQGGFDLLGSGRTKIEKPEQFLKAAEVVQALQLDGLVIVGGDDSNTNAALMAEFFLSKGVKTRVVGVPKTIDGDLQGHGIEISFGFDTACKTFSATIGSLLRDALSAKKYYYFVKLMGRSASHIAVECALQTHPNLTLVGEEVAAKKMTLAQVVESIADLIVKRSQQGKEYGVILVPEGLIEFAVDVKPLIGELNALLSKEKPHAAQLEACKSAQEKVNLIVPLLTTASQACFTALPLDTQVQLLLGRDPHGNVQVSKIESERMLIHMVEAVLKKQTQAGTYKGKFAPQPIFCGYEGRSCLPSCFDANYCYALGNIAALLIRAGKTGYICAIQGLAKPVEEWQCGAIPIVRLMGLETRMGKRVPVIEKTLVALDGPVFKAFAAQRQAWVLDDAYLDPGPIQFWGPRDLTQAITETLRES